MQRIDRRTTDLSRIDLNLLRLFEALWIERHVGRAAARMALSQSATSHALGRLREALGDELFVRNPKGVEPTARATALAPAIAEALAALRKIFAPTGPFDPAQLARKITIGATDYAAFVVIAPALAAVQAAAPNLDLRIVPVDQASVIDALDGGQFDLAIGNFPAAPKRHVSRTLYQERFVGIVRRSHPKLDRRGRMSLSAFVATPHALVSLRGDPHGLVDEALAQRGLKRRVALTVAHFLALPFVVAASDMVGLLAQRAALRLSESAGVTMFKPPLDLPSWDVQILAHEQRAEEPTIAWLANAISAA
jgi:DNA-binding transcriptional LysR family regulator